MSLKDLWPESHHLCDPTKLPLLAFEVEVKSSDNDVFLVDVGGGKGQYLHRLLEKHPNPLGRKIVQHLPSLVAGVDKSVSSFKPLAP
jgi:hypothetical protein